MVSLIMGISSGRLTRALYFYSSERPLIIAHRGACGYLPEHTLQAYELAAQMGADFIEPDLVPTRDHQLLVNHEGQLDETTNISELPGFRHLYTTKTIWSSVGEETETGWFSEDLYLSEIKELRAKQRLPTRIQAFNHLFEKVTLVEVLDWALKVNEKRLLSNQTLLGVYIELKTPGYYNSLGFKVEDLLLRTLRDKGIDTIKKATEKCPVILQSFEFESLEYLHRHTDLPLVYLFESGYVKLNMSEYQDVVNGIGPEMELVFHANGDPKELVNEAHSNNLSVHPFVVREDRRVNSWSRERTYENILKAKIDGIFDEFPKSALAYFSLYK